MTAIVLFARRSPARLGSFMGQGRSLISVPAVRLRIHLFPPRRGGVLHHRQVTCLTPPPPPTKQLASPTRRPSPIVSWSVSELPRSPWTAARTRPVRAPRGGLERRTTRSRPV